MVSNKENIEITCPETSASDQKPEEPANNSKKKSGFFKVLLGIILSMVLISGVTVLGYYTFLPAKPTMLVAEYFTAAKNYKSIDKWLTLYREKAVKPVFENSLKQDSTLSLSTDAASLKQFGMSANTADLMLSALQNISIKYGYSLDLIDKKETVNLGVNLSNTPVLTTNLFLENTKFGFKLPELSEKTLVGDFKDLDKLSEVFPEIDPVLLETYENMDPWSSLRLYNEVKLDKGQLKKLMADYGKELITSIDSGNMSINRGQSIDVLDQEIKCQEVTINLDQTAQKKMLSGILTKLQQDQNAYDLVIGNFNTIIEILSENEMVKQMLSEIGLKNAITIEEYKLVLSHLESSLDQTVLPEEIIVKVYIDGLDIVKSDFVFNSNLDDVRFIFENKTDDFSFNQKITLSGVVEGNSASTILNLKNDYDTASDTFDFIGSCNIDMDIEDRIGNINFTLASEEDLLDNSDVHHIVDSALSFDMMSYGTAQQGESTLTLDGRIKRNDKKLVTENSYIGDLRMNIPDKISQPIYIGFAADSVIEYGQDVVIPEPSKNQVLDLAVAEQEDYAELINEVYGKIGSLFSLFNRF